MTDKLALARLIIKHGVGFSVGGVVAQIVKNNTNPQTTVQAVQTVIGGFVLGTMVGDYAAMYAVNTFDNVVNQVKDARAEKSETTA